MTLKSPDRYCKGIAKSGKLCRAAATASGLCFFHANPTKTSELGRKGGRSKTRVVTESLDPLPALDNTIAVRDALARLIKDVHEGKIALGTAAVLARLLNLQLRALEPVAKLKDRLKARDASMGLGERLRQAHERMGRFAKEDLMKRSSALARISIASC